MASRTDGNRSGLADAGMDSDWPAETVVTVTFAERREARRGSPCTRPSPRRSPSAPGAHPSWLEMLDRLAEELAKA